MFNDEFGEPKELIDALKNYGIALAETMDENINGRIRLAQKIIEAEEAERQLNQVLNSIPVAGVGGKIVNMWNRFEKMLFLLSKVDGKLTMQDFWKMNVYDFLRYKQMLTEHLAEQKPGDDD